MIFIWKEQQKMKKIIRLTESDLHNIISNSVKRILKEDVLGDNWHETKNDVMNNYEPFESQKESYENEHDWGVEGEEPFDPTYYMTAEDAEDYINDPDEFRSDVYPVEW